MKNIIRSTTISILMTLCVSLPVHPEEPDTVPLSNLKVGVARANITPPVGIPLAGYSDRTGPSTGVHDSLYAVVAVFDDGEEKAALVSLDVVTILQKAGDRIHEHIYRACGIPADHVLINVSHTHANARLSENSTYLETVASAVAGAVSRAVSRSRPASIGYGEGAIDFNVNRRIIDEEGTYHSGLNPDGICDHRVKILRIDDGDALEPMAVLMHAVCHANVFRGANTELSADFPGIARTFVERNFGGRTTALFLQGCSGDIRANMPSVGGWKSSIDDFGRSGNEVDMTWCGWTLGAEAVKVATRLRVREQVKERVSIFKIAVASEVLRLDADRGKIESGIWDRAWDNIEDGKILCNVKVLKIGNLWFVGLPGEPVVEYALTIEKEMAGLGHVFVLGYTTGDSGYIPVAHMLAEGGYEAQGAYSPASERQLLDGVRRLVSHLAEQDD